MSTLSKRNQEREVLERGARAIIQQPYNFLGLVVNVETPRRNNPAGVQRASARHSTGNLVPIKVIKRVAAFDKTRDLPPFATIFVDERIIQPQIASHGLGEGLALSIDNLTGTVAGMTVHVKLSVYGKAEREVGEALFDGRNGSDIRSRAPQHCADIIKNLGVDILDERGVKNRNLIKRIKFPYDPRRILSNHHGKLTYMFCKNVLPELGCCFRPLIFTIQNLDEFFRE